MNTEKFYKNIMYILLLLMLSLIIFIPAWIIIMNSMKPVQEANLLGMGLPSRWMFIENYQEVLRTGGVFRAFSNGMIYSVISLIFIVILSAMAAYPIARLSARISNLIYYSFICGLIIPPAVIPMYWLLKNFNLINSYRGLILIYIAMGLPMSIFLYSGFIKTVPRSLDEAATVDGCGQIKRFFLIVFPLLKPVTITVAVFNFMGIWNEVTYQMYFAGVEKWGMPMTIYKFFGRYSQSWNLVFADTVFTVFPVLLFYLIGQKYIVSGMTAGAVKG